MPNPNRKISDWTVVVAEVVDSVGSLTILLNMPSVTTLMTMWVILKKTKTLHLNPMNTEIVQTQMMRELKTTSPGIHTTAARVP